MSKCSGKDCWLQAEDLRLPKIAERHKGQGMLLVIEGKELDMIGRIGKIMDALELEGLGVLVLMQSDCQLLPQVAEMASGSLEDADDNKF